MIRTALILMTSLLVASATASADMILMLDDLDTVGIDVIVVDDADGGVGTVTPRGASNTADGFAGDGVITFSGTVGGFTVNVTTGISKPLITSPWLARNDLNSVNVSGRAGTLRLGLADTDFALTTWPSATFGYKIGGTTDGSVLAAYGIDLGNVAFERDFGFNTGLFGPGAFSDSDAMQIPFPAAPFSLSQFVQITHTSAGQITSLDSEVSAAVPEPGTLALVGAAGIAFALIRRRRKNAA